MSHLPKHLIKHLDELKINNTPEKNAKELNFEGLPESYKEFIIRYGYYDIKGEGIMGIDKNKDTKAWNDSFYIRESEVKYNNIFKTALPIYNMGNGDYFCIDTSRYDPKTKEAPIVYFAHETNELEATVYKDFLHFLQDIVLHNRPRFF